MKHQKAPPSTSDWLRKGIYAGTIGLTGLVSTNVHAELIEYTFTSIQGESRTVTARQSVVNPQGEINFALSAGVDRKVKVSILNDKGRRVSSSIGKILGAEDRITAAGSPYYGEILSLPTPNDGIYTVRAEIMTADGKRSVQQDDYPLIIDTTPPAYTGSRVSGQLYNGTGTGDVWKLGTGGNSGPLIVLDGVTDDNEVSSVELFVEREDKTLYKQFKLNYDSTKKQATKYTNGGVFPKSDLDEEFALTFIITDKAGNKTTVGPQRALYDNVSNHPSEPFGVFDPDHNGVLAPGLNGFVPYSSGMTVKTNPVRLAWRVPKNDWHEYREGGVSLVNSMGELTKAHTDADYVYLVTSTPYGNTDHNYARWSNFGSWGGGGLNYNLKLSESTDKSPRLIGVEYDYSDKGWASFRRFDVNNSLLPLSIKGIRVNAEARSYPQIAVHKGQCTIPVGKTSCSIPQEYTLDTRTTGYIHDNATVYNATKTLRSNPMWAEVNWNDLHYPSLNHEFNEKSKVLTVHVNQPARGAYFDRLRLQGVQIEDANKNVLSVKGQLTDNNVENYTYTFDLKTVPEGNYELVAAATERHGPVTREPLFSYVADTTPPVMGINVKSGSKIQSLDDFEISLRDNVDTEPDLTSILLKGGPASDLIKLSWRKLDSGHFKLEYPIMFPSLKEGEDYTLTVTGADAHGNTTSKVVSFSYEPLQMALADGVDGKIYLPAIASTFHRKNGLSAISTEPLRLGAGETVMGKYDVIVSLRSDSDVPVVINGRKIHPGDAATVSSQHDFSTTGGRIDVPVMAAENGKTGKAHVLITTSAPNSPVATVELNFWNAEVNLQSKSWLLRQVIDQIEVRAVPTKDTMCRLSLSDTIAKKSDAIANPVCLLEWTQIPDEADIATMKPESGDESNDRVVGITGQASRIGQHAIKYQLYMFSGDTKVKVGEGQGEIDVVSAEGAITYKPSENLDEVFLSIQTANLRLTQDEGPKCDLTTSADDAMLYGANKKPNTNLCHLEWLTYPSTLTPDSTSQPSLSGYLDKLGKEEVSWRLSVYSKSGEKINLGSQKHEVNVVNPPAPTIEVFSKFEAGDQYVIPLNDRNLGTALFEGEPADLSISIQEAGGAGDTETFYAGWTSDKNKVNKAISIDHAKGLYGQTDIKLSASYTLLPDIAYEKNISVISAPATNIEPHFVIENNDILDTEALNLTVTMLDRSAHDRIYRKEYGRWSVGIYQRIRSLREDDKLLELSAPVETNEDGQASFSIDMSNVDGSGARIVAIATLIHDIPDYEYTSESKSVFASVMYGGEVDGEITSKKYSGESAYSAYLQFVPYSDNNRSGKALGATRWAISDDDGATWEELEPSSRPVLSRSFEKGIYQIKTTSINRFSGAEFTSSAVEIVVYDKPQLEIKGPGRLMMGDTATLKVVPSTQGEERHDDGFVFEWSTDNGETFVSGTSEHTVTQDEPGTYQLRARVREVDAPQDDSKAWSHIRLNPRFYPVKGPVIGMRIPNRVEVGEEYQITATATPRVTGMHGNIVGEFVMPDGTRHGGTELTYTPTKEEEVQGRVSISYEAWFEDFKEQSTEMRTANIRVREYIWPSFKMRPFGTIRFAPSKIMMSAIQDSNATSLDKPVYTWGLPEGAEVLRETGNRIEFMINEGGDYDVSVVVSDARGNSSETETQISLEDAPPWDIERYIKYSNEQMREPLTVSYRPQFKGGHPLDRVDKKQFFVNGELFKEGGFTAKQELGAGKHVISVEMKSRYGQIVTDEIEVEVANNILPVCTVETIDLDSKWRVVPDCTDEDGIVRTLQWSVNGIESSGSRYKTFIKSRLNEITEVEVVALDDSGGSSVPVSITLMPEQDATEENLDESNQQQ